MTNDDSAQMLDCEITRVVQSWRRRLQGVVDIEVEVLEDFSLVAPYFYDGIMTLK